MQGAEPYFCDECQQFISILPASHARLHQPQAELLAPNGEIFPDGRSSMVIERMNGVSPSLSPFDLSYFHNFNPSSLPFIQVFCCPLCPEGSKSFNLPVTFQQHVRRVHFKENSEDSGSEGENEEAVQK